jgi:hypothetical protein
MPDMPAHALLAFHARHAGHAFLTFHAGHAGHALLHRCKNGAPCPKRPPPMASHILVAEDQADIRDLIVLNLQQAGYAVTAVPDGRAALARTRPSARTTC